MMFFAIGAILAIFLWYKIQVDSALLVDRFGNPIQKKKK